MSAQLLDYSNPNYTAIFVERMRRINAIRKNPSLIPKLKLYYRDHIPDFIADFGITIDPRNASRGLPVVVPFILFPKQREWLEWIIDRWRMNEPGLTEKSRDMGVSWLAMALSCSMCLLYRDIAIGFGSAKEDKVDRSGDPDSLFYKGRMFMHYLPREFKGDWDIKRNSAHMRMLFPSTDSSITGEAGDNIGRGGRKAIYFVDEAAHIERPKLIDASLSANTDCRQDMSSVNGMANSFAEKRHGGKTKVFTFDWRSDPRKTDEWAEKKRDELDPVIWAAEYDINYSASVEGVIIPFEWVDASIDLHKRLGITPTGARRAALDVADRGMDKNAFGFATGVLLEHVESWSGKMSDIFATTQTAFRLCDEHNLRSFDYDADGLGAGVRGDARVINEQRTQLGDDRRPKAHAIKVSAFRGSAAVLFPERKVPKTDRKNEDMFKNFKAQSWWALRFRFQESYNAFKGKEYDPAAIISIDSSIKELSRLKSELSQPVWETDNSGKILVDKAPDETMSPNLADCVMMIFAPRKPVMNIGPDVFDNLARS